MNPTRYLVMAGLNVITSVRAALIKTSVSTKILILSLVLSGHVITSAYASTSIPFVGCADAGEALPTIVPSAQPFVIDAPARIASKLAVYAGHYMAVVAPRGWKCEATSGTAGAALWVYPAAASYLTKGPIVSEAIWGGNETGNAYVVSYGGRYFPSIINGRYIEDFIAGTGQTRNQFLIPRYKSDVVVYVGENVLQFLTPAGHNGLGKKVLGESTIAVDGLMGITSDPHVDTALYLFGVRLSSNEASLKNYIIMFSRDCFTKTINSDQLFCSLNVNMPDEP